MEDFKVRKEGVKEMTGIMEQIRNEGLKQGIQKGAKQNSIQIAENMLKDRIRACQEFCVIEFLFHSLTLSSKTMENWLRASPQFLIG